MSHNKDKAPKILTLDIETAPGEAYFWSRFDQFSIPLERVKKPTRVICWSAKWLGQKEMYYADEYMAGGPKAMFTKIHELMSEADAIVTFNGDKFDLQRLNGAFVEHRLGPVPPFASIDLHKTVKRLGLISSSLQFISTFLQIGQKIKHAGFSLWTGWNDKLETACKKMKSYNMKDVRLTERVYRELRPYIKSHPYLRNPDVKKHKCSRCGSTKTQCRGFRYTAAFRIQRVLCTNCNGWDTGARTKVKANVAN